MPPDPPPLPTFVVHWHAPDLADTVATRVLLRILMEDEDDIALNFACASHEQDDERHVIVTPDRDFEFENGGLVTS